MPSSRFEASLDCYLWDLVDEGIDDVLDRIKGETGATGIVVPVHGKAVATFRPHAGVSPRAYVYDGGALFQPDASRYAGTRLRPVVFDGIRKSNPLKTIVQASHARGLKVGCAVAACDCGPVAERYEHAAVRDILGDRHHWLCPVNPDVQEYVRSLLGDLTENYELDSLRLGDLGFAGSGNADERGDIEAHSEFVLGPVEAWLGNICFCESCRQLSKRDGVNLDAAAAVALETLESACRTGDSSRQTIAEFAEDREPLAAYLDWRTAQLNAWIGTLKTTCRCMLMVDPHPDTMGSGISMESVFEAFDVLACQCPRVSAAAVEAELAKADSAWDRSRVAVRVSAGSGCPDSQSLVAAVAKIAKSGCHSAEISNYGSIPMDRLDWIRQAIRFARRESSFE